MASAPSNTYISALLLAAGMGERMGGAKQLLPLGRQRMIEVSLHNLLASQVDEVVVVLGFAAAEIRPFVERNKRVKVVVNPRFQQGMSSSIHQGLKVVDPRCTGVLIALADQPFIPAEVINTLIERFAAGEKGIVLPVYQGQRGHPVILSQQLYESELFDLQGDVGGKEIVRDHPEDVEEVEVASKGVVVDIDEPADYEKIQFK
jgi:molybdenum cofactor cytidylyltransferase